MTAKNKFKMPYNKAGVTDGYTMQQIADIEGLSRERVRQILERGLDKMRKHCNVKELSLEDLISSSHPSEHTYSLE